MSPQIRRLLLLGVVLLAAACLLCSLTACSKKTPPAPAPLPAPAAQGPLPNPPGGEPGAPPGPALQASQKCRTLCKDMCMRGRQCNLPTYNNVLRCGRVCLAVCARGLVSDSIENCVKPEVDCTQVSKCLTDLRAGIMKRIQEMKAKRDAGQQPAAPGPSAPSAEAPAAPPTQ